MPVRISCIRPRALLVIVGLALLAATACIGPKPLVNPPPIGAAATPAQTRVAILRALAWGGWVLEADKPGAMVARFRDDDWNMLIEIDYSNEIMIRYVSSENLDYGTSKEGVVVIHRGYNLRTQKLAKAIGTEVMIARATELPPVAAPPPAPASEPTPTPQPQ